MKENTQEKNLIEKQEKSLFGKIKNFFAKIFGKKVENSEVSEEELTNNPEIINEEDNKEFKESIKVEEVEDEEAKILDLQRRYRRGEIADNDLTDEQIDALSNLYDKQIEALKKAIAEKEQKIAEYKNKKQKV